ncbi:MAG: DNA repair protein RadC [Bacteroidetes bacterium]|nr:DNA repair protein RadC [Bacteroidota bacterium]
MSYQHTPITHWAEQDRPREKLLSRGVNALTDAELLAILIGSGTRELSAVELSRKLLQDFDGLRRLAQSDVSHLMKYKGIGEAKAISIVAAFELARRKQLTESRNISVGDPATVAAYLAPRMEDLPHEIFYVLYLNQRNQIVGEREISSGGTNGTIIDPKLVFREALNLLATGLIISHNHPSGNLRPSEADLQLTRKLREAALLFDIRLLDHIIIAAGNGYVSFAEQNLL